MATVVRLTRMGRKKKPFYRIVVTDSRKRRDGGWIESIGYYNPMVEPEVVKFDAERLAYWKGVGAKLSDRVAKITSKYLKMVENFLLEYAKLIADFPEKVKLERVELGENFAELIIYADKVDTGKLIGKDGRMINAIKTVIVGYKAKDATSYRVTVKPLE